MSATAPRDSDLQAVTAGAIVARLDEIIRRLQNQGNEPASIAYGGAPTYQVLENWPVSGRKRIVMPYRGEGGLIAVAASPNATDLLPNNPARGGLKIVNYGANACFVYLTRAGDATPGSPVIYIPAAGDWDGKVSGEVWCGPLAVQSTAGTNLTLAAI